jgi:hypothetical protein
MMQGSLFLWKTSWLLSHAMKECEVANFYGQPYDAYAYVWMVQDILFSWIALWHLWPTLNRCKVSYFHGTLHNSYSMQWRKVFIAWDRSHDVFHKNKLPCIMNISYLAFLHSISLTISMTFLFSKTWTHRQLLMLIGRHGVIVICNRNQL